MYNFFCWMENEMIVCLCFGVIIWKIGIMFCLVVYFIGLNDFFEECRYESGVISKLGDCRSK